MQTGALQIDDPKRFKFDGDDFYLKSRGRDARPVRASCPRRATTRCSIAERADVEIEFGHAVLPSFPVPEGHDENSYLRELTMRGREGALRRRRPRRTCIERIEYELDVIKSMGFSAYFLVVWDLVRYAKSRGIRVGPGRGSAAGSCVAYCLRIVDIDPIKYDLLFERFLNPGRKQMPDIDMDFDSRYRGEMIKYAAQNATATTTSRRSSRSPRSRRGPRCATRARVLGYPYVGRRQDRQAHAAADHGPRHAAARVPRAERRSYDDGYKMAAELRALYDADPDAKRVIDVARGPRGAAPPGRHPRRRGRDHPRAAHRVPADPAQARARRRRSRTRRSSRSTRCTASKTSAC